MSSCCTSSKNGSSCTVEIPKTAICLRCGQSHRQVDRRTLLHQVKSPPNQNLPEQGYYFCTCADCNVVYFGQDNSVITKDQVRREVGQKSINPNRQICYCFDVTETQIREELQKYGQSPSKAFVVEQTKLHTCACEIRNPSGKCCLGDFAKVIQSAGTCEVNEI